VTPGLSLALTPELALALALGLPLALALGLLLALAPRLPLGLQPYNPIAFGPGPKTRVATSRFSTFHDANILRWDGYCAKQRNFECFLHIHL